MHQANTNTGKRGAVRINSGEPVYPSGPELGVGPTTPLTAGRTPEACPPDLLGAGAPAPSQRKKGRELEGSALEGGEAACSLASLDQLQINRNNADSKGSGIVWAAGRSTFGFDEIEDPEYRERVREKFNKTWGRTNEYGRNKNCGRFSLHGTSDAHPGRSHYLRVNCKCWDCRYCGPRKAKRYKHAIRATAEQHKLSRFLTLTLDPAKIHGREPVRYLNQVWAEFRVYLKRRLGNSPQYIRILEFQKNGNPHFHILIDRYIPQQWVSEAWSAVGGGRIVDIRYVDLHQVSRYLSKYLTKELLMSAPRRSRRVTTSRGIHLFEKTKKELRWQFLRIPIWLLLEAFRKSVVETEFDEENVLCGFSILENAAA